MHVDSSATSRRAVGTTCASGFRPTRRMKANSATTTGVFGYVHSYETSSRYDGPGPADGAVRVGMPAALHLLPQSRYLASEGRHLRFRRNRCLIGLASFAPALRSLDGGLTISGGEPMVQLEFTRRILAGAKQMGLHTAIETSGFLGDQVDDRLPVGLDLVLLDIKSSDPETYRKVTGRDLAPTLRFAERLAQIGKPAWVRFTLVPGHTDDPANVEGIARFVAPMKNVEWVEVQPFHQMGAFKWKAMNLEYKHADTPPPTPELIKRVIEQFRAAGCNAR